jgi:pimeloyl-ACP methyl ester carboxylesterase
MGESYPLVYVRGYAGGQAGIDNAVSDPFYGFNDGATHVRVNGDGDPRYYQFEGPLLRLITDENYQVLVYGDQHTFLENCPPATTESHVPHESLWVYRFYDDAASTFGEEPEGFELLTAAQKLLCFVQLVLEKTGAEKVFLVAHSMGGLVARSMLQKVCPEAHIDPTKIVDKFFTFATPHAGIKFSPTSFLNITVPQWAPFGAAIFNRKVMYRYLTPHIGEDDDPPDVWDAQDMPDDTFDTRRTFCLIGTDAADYGAVSKAVGPESDGLVQIDRAYVRNANRAFIHRAHSGIYGEVNSEEGYQNLRRFLFGNRQVEVHLHNLQLPEPDPEDVENGIRDIWQAEIRLSVRGLPVVISEQLAAHYCPIQLSPKADNPLTTVPLTTVFLLAPDRDTGRRDETGQVVSPRCRYTLQMRVIHIQERHRRFHFTKFTDTAADWEDTLLVDVGPGPDGPPNEHLFAEWNSRVIGVNANKDPIADNALTPDTSEPGTSVFTVSLSAAGRAILGNQAEIRMRVVENWDARPALAGIAAIGA